MKIGVFHPGTQHSWQTALALQELGRLAWFHSSIVYQPDRWPYRLERLPAPVGPWLAAEFHRFDAGPLDPALVRTSGLTEWLERIARRGGAHRLAERLDRYGNARFGQALVREIAGDAPFALWGYDSSARTAFLAAKARGRLCILDRTVGHRRTLNRVMAEVREDWPAWFGQADPPRSAAALAGEDEEMALADRIVVGSETAAATLREEAASDGITAKLKVVPYSYDERLFAAQPIPEPSVCDRPVRFLLVGQLGPRKGLHLLLHAIARIPAAQASLTLVGGLAVPRAAFAPYADRVRLIPHVARSAIPALMAAHDVLVFPSYFEGSALSLIEALASGLGIIQSRQAGNGATPACGLILPELSVDALVAAMMVPIRDRDRLDHWRQAARREAGNYTFARYRDNIAALLDEVEMDEARPAAGDTADG